MRKERHYHYVNGEPGGDKGGFFTMDHGTSQGQPNAEEMKSCIEDRWNKEKWRGVS